VFNMNPEDHMGLSVDAFKLLEVRKGNWVIID
jgi:branched-chain amino acid transport system substrate-binding protein